MFPRRLYIAVAVYVLGCFFITLRCSSIVFFRKISSVLLDLFLLFSTHLHFYFSFVSLPCAIDHMSTFFLSTWIISLCASGHEYASLTIQFRSRYSYNPFITTLKWAYSVGPSPSSHSGTNAAVEKIVALSDEQRNEKAVREGTQDQQLLSYTEDAKDDSMKTHCSP